MQTYIHVDTCRSTHIHTCIQAFSHVSTPLHTHMQMHTHRVLHVIFMCFFMGLYVPQCSEVRGQPVRAGAWWQSPLTAEPSHWLSGNWLKILAQKQKKWGRRRKKRRKEARILSSPSWLRTCYATKDDLRLLTHLPLTPEDIAHFLA